MKMLCVHGGGCPERLSETTSLVLDEIESIFDRPADAALSRATGIATVLRRNLAAAALSRREGGRDAVAYALDRGRKCRREGDREAEYTGEWQHRTPLL